MIEDPPILTVCQTFSRPDRGHLGEFSGASTSNVVDALGGSGALSKNIRPLINSGQTIVGGVVTCNVGPRDNLALFAAFDIAKPGDIVVAACDGFADAALFGDLMAGMALNCGIAAIITDGAIRDVESVKRLGLPVYCTGISANSPACSGPGSVGLPISIGGLRVYSGDIAIADTDGVVFVSLKDIPSVAARQKAIIDGEAELEVRIKRGLKIPPGVRSLLDSNQVVRVTTESED